MFGAFGSTPHINSIAFVSGASVDLVRSTYGLVRRVVPVGNCRKLSKADLIFNDVCPNITVDPETYQVFADGIHLTCEPGERLPLTQMYHLF
jgi:urease subunit alpha